MKDTARVAVGMECNLDYKTWHLNDCKLDNEVLYKLEGL